LKTNRPSLSIIVGMYSMTDEIGNTIFSLSPDYQHDVSESEYEVLIVDNGSNEPLPHDLLRTFPKNVDYNYIDRTSPSPVAAINRAANRARGQYIGLLIDGARISTPGMLSFGLRALAMHDEPVATTITFHIGPDLHRKAIARGYTKSDERALLESIDWRSNPYKLFEVSAPGGSSLYGWFLGVPETSFLFTTAELLKRVGGLDERFQSPGGGLAMFDLCTRLCSVPDSQLMMLLGEATFHQMHSGAMTGTTVEESRIRYQQFKNEYRRITESDPARQSWPTILLGHMPDEASDCLLKSTLAFKEANSSNE